MKTQNKLKNLFLLVIVIFILIILTIGFYFIKREEDINDSHNINILRAYTLPVINLVNNDFPNLDNDSLDTLLDELKLKAQISDLNNNILYNNTSFTSTDVVHDLYQDQTYSSNNVDMIKVAFPIEDDLGIVGIVIFEVPVEQIVDNDYSLLVSVIILELVLLTGAIISLIRSYKRNVLKPLDELDTALLDISRGIYNKLGLSDKTTIKNFTNYNIMLDKLEDTLNNQADYAKARKQLIANISHEIRTPLSYVKISAEILSNDKNLSSENKKHLETILNKITLIDNIIEDLFRYSQQDLDKLLVELKEVYAKDMFDRVFSNIKPKDQTKKIEIKITNNLPNVLMNADENRIVQVISNMVDNAEKHIKNDGFINITSEIDENHVVLVIEDSGEGIEAKDLPYIFEAFYQGKQDKDVKKQGAGLGLAICDYIIKKHHGEIFVYSEKNKGTKFVIKFQEIL